MNTPEVILFDVGGVLVELGPHPLPPELDIPLASYSASRATISFEKGRIGAEEFGRSIVDELGLDVDSSLLVEHFRLWPTAPFPGVHDLLSGLRRQYKVAILSNTNELHWPRFDTEFGLLGRCDRIFASHLLGMLKPEAAIFAHVIDALETEPRNILFLDDNPANVDGARAGGMQAELVSGVAGAVRALAARGIVDASGRIVGPAPKSQNSP